MADHWRVSGQEGVGGPGDITLALERWSAGEPDAFDRLAPLVYDDLRRIARWRLQHEARGQTINTFDLVHEAWIRFQRGAVVPITHRGHFLAFASRLMRQVLTDHARTRLRLKRGEGQHALPIEEWKAPVDSRLEEVLRVSEALDRLAADYPRKARVFEMRYFGGFEVTETAGVLDISKNTVVRDYDFACAWLRRELSGSGRP